MISTIQKLNTIVYNALRHSQVKKYNEQKTARTLNDKQCLSIEQVKEVSRFFAPYVKSVNTIFHAFFTEKTGIYDVRYIPQDIYTNYIDEYYNDIKAAKYIDNKCLYSRLFPGIRLAESLVYRMNGFYLNSDYRIVSGYEAVSIIASGGETGVFVKKATASYGGHGVEYIGAEKMNPEELLKKLEETTGDLVIQRPIIQHQALSRLNPDSVNSIRILSLLRQEGVIVLSCVLRMGLAGSKVDNASSGGIVCGIDNDGKLIEFAYRPTGERFESHPTSGVVFKGVSVPGFTKALEMIKKAHEMIPDFRLVSWDIAIDENTLPVMIEVNLARGELDFHQLCNGPVFGDMTETVLQEVFCQKKH